MTEISAYSTSLREEELKNKVAADWFGAFDCTRIIGNIDFCVDFPATELALGYEAEPMLWAEAKAGNKKDIVASFVQLILTIGGEHTADKNLPPHFLGAFDAEKIAFLPYNAVLDVLGDLPQPWGNGSYSFAITFYWWVDGSSQTNQFATNVQTFRLFANGDAEVSKFGWTAHRGTNGVQIVTRESQP